MNPVPQSPALLVVATVVLAVVVLALLVWLGQRGKADADDDREPSRPAAAPSSATAPPTTATPAAGLERVQAAIAAGQKIEAIKLYRELTGLGLRESKDAVEAMASGASVPFVPRTQAAPPLGMEEVTRLARTGQLIPAIKLHRELTGMGLKESKDAVERLRDGG